MTRKAAAKATTPVNTENPPSTPVEPDEEVKYVEPAKPNKELPRATILVCTYNRLKLLEETLERLSSFIYYPPELLTWIICDDSSPDGYAEKVAALPIVVELGAKVVSTDKNGGWAKNVNNGLAQVTDDYVYFTEDDYFATAPIRLDAMVALMETKPDIGLVRVRGIAGTHIVAHLFEADIKDYIPDWQDGVGLIGKIAYFQLDSGSPTPYVYSNGPHVKHRRFHEHYGVYPEGLLLGETEEAYAHTVKDKMHASPDGAGAPAVVILPQDVYMYFDHVGDSYQLTDADKRHD